MLSFFSFLKQAVKVRAWASTIDVFVFTKKKIKEIL